MQQATTDQQTNSISRSSWTISWYSIRWTQLKIHRLEGKGKPKNAEEPNDGSRRRMVPPEE